MTDPADCPSLTLQPPRGDPMTTSSTATSNPDDALLAQVTGALIAYCGAYQGARAHPVDAARKVIDAVRRHDEQIEKGTSPVYVVIVEDRHADTDVEIFTDVNAAIDCAKRIAADYAHDPADIDDSSCPDSWVYRVRYSVEGDSVRVVAKTLDGEVA